MNLRSTFLVAALAVLSSAPVVAAQGDGGTPEQDLDCAIWASRIAGSTSDAQMQIGAAAIVGFFIGRYEIATGREIDDAMVARTLALGDEGIKAAAAQCGPRALIFGNRLSALGKRIVDEAKRSGQ